MKIGSLFDGSGGFPLAAALCGGTPVWASEVEPYPIAVTRSRFPSMKHLGSVTDVKGNEVEPVDVITFGSPCQDLSVAGKRAGLKHTENGDDETTRSGLFMEAVRIIKEMREATNGLYPRFAVWENVPGAFSSNKGEDFRIVLEEFIKIVEPTAVMPTVPKNGWPYADSYCGDGWSLSYRVFDAQFWGVPQRRRRIYLVADFRGQCAGKISFEREGLRGYLTQSGSPWEAAARDAESGTGATDCTGSCVTLEPGIAAREGGHIYEGVCGTLRANAGDNQMAVAYGISSYESNAMKSANPHSGVYEADTARTLDLNGGNPACNQGGIAIVEAVGFDGYNSTDTGDKVATLGVNCGMSTGRNGVCVPYTLKIRSGCAVDSAGKSAGKGALIQTDKAATLAVAQDQYLFQPVAISSKQQSLVTSENMANTLGANDYKEPQAVFQPICSSGEVAGTLDASYYKGCGMRQGVEREYVVEPILDDQGGSQISVRTDGKSPTLRAEMHGNVPCVMSIENHPADSRVNIDDSGKVQTLTSRMGTGGGNVPMVMEPMLASGKEVAGCLMASGYDKLGAQEMFSGDYTVIEKQPTATYWDGGQTAGTLTANNANGAQRMPDKDNFNCVIALDRAFFNQGANAQYDPQFYTDGTVPTLVARGPSAVAVRYIVRRLTPTECARLQGFPDEWGHPDIKESISDEEYRFWLEVRNTHAAINGKATKEYTREQMLKWLNGLHTDSSEYKMWGNGIALPCALYVMQGIAEVLNEN